MEWVEVQGKTVDVAVAAALAELGLASRDDVVIEVVQEPERGFLGIGGRDAIVQVKPKPKKRRRNRGRKRSGDNKDARGQKPEAREPGGGGPRTDRPRSGRKPEKSPSQEQRDAEEATVTTDEQVEVIRRFLVGLLDAFGLEGDVVVTAEDDAIIAKLEGEQTEALVGAKGAIMQAIHELVRTVVQRQTRESVRIRLDIAGYAERRREALAIYAGRLAEQVLEEGTEIMLEPMNPADRKVVHDSIQKIDGVRSYSEGEEPRRSVVLSPE